ncbi:MAG: hypothetical protein UV92_C0004G0018 [Parcubacteria group bacterium GW2011_GWA1_43_27]|nr:MAG: hypothetical protein UV92_C0004G0018 [Parcubacteria group bacterium GW2011_GWA1_43_27]KKT21944.1 MAG: hypothetical protein UW06_C0025G0001 [Parcubacteria group bacterium GW2011_GWE1_43_8]HCM45691.1 hypothetical protein [Candidatus Veblenbacteria bacterium]
MATKQEILQEIKRTAKENRGQTLGQTTFRKVTGIGLHEWTKYWARWGDAVREAKVRPNRKWMYYPDDILIRKVISKIRKYHKYPTIYELKVDVNNGDDFPLHIFKKRKQAYIVEKVLEFCKGKRAYKDIVLACEPILKKLDTKSASSTRSDEVGEVYLFKSGRYYKIGKAKDTVRRGSELRIQLPEQMVLIHKILTDDPYGVEEYWHKRFSAKAMKGEWFNLDPSDIVAFKRWKKII